MLHGFPTRSKKRNNGVMAKADPLDKFIRSASFVPERHYITSSLLSLNAIINNSVGPQGFQSGRSLDIVGTMSTGKSTLALDLIAQAQRQGLLCAYADVERAFDARYAQVCGVDIDKLQLIVADTAENNLSTVEKLARTGTKLIVIDSITALIPQAHSEESPEDENHSSEYYEKNRKIAALGSMLGDWVKRMVPIIDYHNVTLVYINQFRANFSTMSRVEKKPYGPNAYHHYLTWRVELARVENAEDRTTVEAKCTKNRLGTERRVCRYGIIYGQGLDVNGDTLVHAIRAGIVEKSGKWYYYHKGAKDEIKDQGEANAVAKFPMKDIRAQLETGEL